METYLQLLKSWKLDEEAKNNHKFIARSDRDDINNDLLAMNLSVPPQPFWGNIINPSIIVLFNNPNINPSNVDEEYEKALFDNIAGIKPFDFLENKDGNYIWDNNDSKYWQNRFRDIKDVSQAETQNITNFNELIGEFEFHGYNSLNFRKFKCSDNKDGYIPTQVALFNHLKYLIEKYNPLIIIARGKRNWMEALGLEDLNPNIICVRSPQSAYLSKRENNKGNIESDQFTRIIERIKTDFNKKTNKS